MRRLHPHTAPRGARRARPWAVLLQVAAICSGCTSTLEQARRAYGAGNLLEARYLLQQDRDPGQTPPGAEEKKRAALAHQIETAIDETVHDLLQQAAHAAKTPNSPKHMRLAWKLYRAAHSMLRLDDPRFQQVQVQIDQLQGALAALEAEYTELEEALLASKNAPAAVSEPHPLARMALLCEAVKRPCDQGARALAMGREAFASGLYGEAVSLLELGSLLQESHGGYDTAETKILLSLARRRAPPTQAAAEPTDPAPPEQPKRASAKRTRSRRRQRARPPKAVEEPPPQIDPIEEEMEQVLNAAQQEYLAGDVFAALVRMVAAVRRYQAHPKNEALVAQEAQWKPDRKAMVQQLLQRAEQALRNESPDAARAAYVKVLALEPEHRVAEDRMRKLDRLQELKQRMTRPNTAH